MILLTRHTRLWSEPLLNEFYKEEWISFLCQPGATSVDIDSWSKQKLKELEGDVTVTFWYLSLHRQDYPEVWQKIYKLMERYQTETEKAFIAKVRRFIRRAKD